MFDLPIAVTILGQNIVPADLATIGLLIVLEGLLSIDNALVLGMLAKRLPKHMRARALSYGLVGAFVARVIAIVFASYLLQYTFVKLLGGAYLVFIALKHLLLEQQEEGNEKLVLDELGNPKLVDADTGESLDVNRENIEIEQRVPIAASLVTQDGEDAPGTTYPDNASCNVEKHSMGLFWKTVFVIEVTDIAFAVDSILAAMAVAGSQKEKLWVVITGGILGVVLMRYAASIFVRLLEKFPRFEISAYLLVSVIGFKLLADWAFNSDWSFQGASWLGTWQPWFAGIENMRLSWVTAYENWLTNSWPLGMGAHHDAGPVKVAAKLLDFHDFRRPECSGFWLIMLVCFFFGFLPKKSVNSAHS
jgi:predicted tellurium resistance membrane protein TerC